MSLEQLSEHSPVGPSSGDRWLHCPGSVAATKDLPDTTSDFAAEGTFAHYITELARNENKDAKHYLNVTSEDGKFTCDKEMVTAVQDFLDYMEQWEGDTFVEQRVHYDGWVDNGFGTSDHICIEVAKKHCLVADFKYGKNPKGIVYAKGNIQDKLYALGVFQDFGFLYDIDDFTLVISQPRLGHRDQWEISTEKLLKWADDVVEPAADRVYEAIEHLENDGEVPSTYFKAGSWCQWCGIKGECKTRAAMVRDSVLIGVDILDDDEAITSNPNALDDTELGEAATNIEQIEKWCTDITAILKKRVMAGARILSGEDDEGEPEHWFMATGRSNRVWKDAATAEKKLRGARLKVDQIFTKKMIGPAGAETLLGAKHKALLGQIFKPQGKPVLVPGSDSRKPYAVTTDEMEKIDDDTNIDDNDTSWLDE
jgi:hypothetical protein